MLKTTPNPQHHLTHRLVSTSSTFDATCTLLANLPALCAQSDAAKRTTSQSTPIFISAARAQHLYEFAYLKPYTAHFSCRNSTYSYVLPWLSVHTAGRKNPLEGAQWCLRPTAPTRICWMCTRTHGPHIPRSNSARCISSSRRSIITSAVRPCNFLPTGMWVCEGWVNARSSCARCMYGRNCVPNDFGQRSLSTFAQVKWWSYATHGDLIGTANTHRTCRCMCGCRVTLRIRH